MGERRRRLMVDRFQYTIVVRMVVYWLVYQVTLWNFLFCWRLIKQGRGDLWQQLGDYWRDSYPMLFCFMALVPAFALDAVKLCHRFAGPIHRFRATARQVAGGEPVQPIRLRQGDELAELAADFNQMLHALALRGAVRLVDPRSNPADQRQAREGQMHRDEDDLASGTAQGNASACRVDRSECRAGSD